MSQQPDLFTPIPRLTAPYQRGSETSRAAAIKAQAFVGHQGATVLAWLTARGEHGGTQREAAAALSISRQSLCARFRALEQTSAILKTGERRGHCVVYAVMAR